MVKRLASLYAEKALNERLYERSLIPESLYAAASEGIALEIDRLLRSLYDRSIVSTDGGGADGSVGGQAATG